MGQTKLEGVLLTPQKVIATPKGDVYHAMKASDSSFSGFGEAYFSSVNFGEIKGWKKHTRMVLNLVVVSGEIKFVIYDDRETSKTKNQFFEVRLSLNNYQRLTVPAGVWMGFQGLGQEKNLLLNIASLEHDPNEAIAQDLKDISYEW